MKRSVSSANVHTLLNLMLSKAALNGEVGKGHIFVQLTDLLKEQDRTDFLDDSPDAQRLILRIDFALDWVSADEIDIENEVNIEMKDVEEIDYEPEPKDADPDHEISPRKRVATNKNKKSQ